MAAQNLGVVQNANGFVLSLEAAVHVQDAAAVAGDDGVYIDSFDAADFFVEHGPGNSRLFDGKCAAEAAAPRFGQTSWLN